MRLSPWILLVLLVTPSLAVEQKLPPLRDGSVVSGPGTFQHEGELEIRGHVTLKNLTLDLHGPIRVAKDATLELDGVKILVSDPPGASNGVSGLRCEGPARVVVRNSTMEPLGTAHPMWGLQGEVEVDNFQTKNAEFHFNQVRAKLNRLKIFELEISRGSDVVANHLELVFLSTHTGEDDHLQVDGIPADKEFSRTLNLGSGAKAELHDVRLELFLVYVHGKSSAQLSHIGRAQLAFFPQCQGSFHLPIGVQGSQDKPAVFPAEGASNCPFRIAMNEVNVDTWDVYTGGNADLTFTDSVIDELILNGHAKVKVRNSELYADWLGVSDDAQLNVESSTVGALRLAAKRPDLATSQARIGGRARALFSKVRFDCGVVASGQAQVEINAATRPPQYLRTSDTATIRVDGTVMNPGSKN
ncbi:MAG: hypothetical protein JST79_14015 [Acidobacteria bacterium]|nr:hypothetical protein [Acidobacteriota bacterium]